MTRRPPLLLSLILERRAAAPAFTPRTLSAEDHERLAAMGARGQWEKTEAGKVDDIAEIRRMGKRAEERAATWGGPMPSDETWGGRA